MGIAFSSGLENLLKEAILWKNQYGQELFLVHVGHESEEKKVLLENLFSKLQEPMPFVFWLQGGERTEVILDFVSEKEIDLLITATEEKENMAKYLLLGSLSRALCRKCRCSMLMLTPSHISAQLPKNVVVSGIDHPKTVHTLDTVLKMAIQHPFQQLIVVEELPLEQMAVSMESSTFNREDGQGTSLTLANPALEQQIMLATPPTETHWKVEKMEGKPGHCVSSFARQNGMDLLVLNSPDTELGLMDKVFPHDLEYALGNLPCNLLVVHPRNFDWN